MPRNQRRISKRTRVSRRQTQGTRKVQKGGSGVRDIFKTLTGSKFTMPKGLSVQLELEQLGKHLNHNECCIITSEENKWHGNRKGNIFLRSGENFYRISFETINQFLKDYPQIKSRLLGNTDEKKRLQDLVKLFTDANSIDSPPQGFELVEGNELENRIYTGYHSTSGENPTNIDQLFEFHKYKLFEGDVGCEAPGFNSYFIKKTVDEQSKYYLKFKTTGHVGSNTKSAYSLNPVEFFYDDDKKTFNVGGRTISDKQFTQNGQLTTVLLNSLHMFANAKDKKFKEMARPCEKDTPEVPIHELKSPQPNFSVSNPTFGASGSFMPRSEPEQKPTRFVPNPGFGLGGKDNGPGSASGGQRRKQPIEQKGNPARGSYFSISASDASDATEFELPSGVPTCLEAYIFNDAEVYGASLLLKPYPEGQDICFLSDESKSANLIFKILRHANPGMTYQQLNPIVDEEPYLLLFRQFGGTPYNVRRILGREMKNLEEDADGLMGGLQFLDSGFGSQKTDTVSQIHAGQNKSNPFRSPPQILSQKTDPSKHNPFGSPPKTVSQKAALSKSNPFRAGQKPPQTAEEANIAAGEHQYLEIMASNEPRETTQDVHDVQSQTQQQLLQQQRQRSSGLTDPERARQVQARPQAGSVSSIGNSEDGAALNELATSRSSSASPRGSSVKPTEQLSIAQAEEMIEEDTQRAIAQEANRAREEGAVSSRGSLVGQSPEQLRNQADALNKLSKFKIPNFSKQLAANQAQRNEDMRTRAIEYEQQVADFLRQRKELRRQQAEAQATQRVEPLVVQAPDLEMGGALTEEQHRELTPVQRLEEIKRQMAEQKLMARQSANPQGEIRGQTRRKALTHKQMGALQAQERQRQIELERKQGGPTLPLGKPLNNRPLGEVFKGVTYFPDQAQLGDVFSESPGQGTGVIFGQGGGGRTQRRRRVGNRRSRSNRRTSRRNSSKRKQSRRGIRTRRR